MAYPAYDSYNYPNRQSMYGDYAYADPVVGYGDVSIRCLVDIMCTANLVSPRRTLRPTRFTRSAQQVNTLVSNVCCVALNDLPSQR